jgi:hypothetical protein
MSTEPDDMERARGLLTKNEVTPEDRKWLLEAAEQAGGDKTPVGGFLWGCIRSLSQKDAERASAVLAAAMQKADAERVERARQRAENWKALPALSKAAFLIFDRDRDDPSRKILSVVQLAAKDLSSTEPPDTFEPPNQ